MYCACQFVALPEREIKVIMYATTVDIASRLSKVDSID